MKIIEQGVPQVWTYSLNCTGAGNRNDGCGAKLEAEKSDLLHTYSSSMGRFTQDYLSIKCPCCGTYTDLDLSGIPDWIKWPALRQPIHVPV